MKAYRWTCNACDTGNDSNTTKCKNCGCPANASGEDIERHKDPEGFHKNKAEKEGKERYLKGLSAITIWIPMATAICIFRGGIESIAILFFIGIFLIIKNIDIFLHIWNTTWSRATLLVFSSLQFILFSIRSTLIDDNSSAVYWFVLFLIFLMAVQYFYFFISERGKQLFSEFFESHYVKK